MGASPHKRGSTGGAMADATGEFVERRVRDRLTGGLVRRWRYWRGRLTGRAAEPPVAAAVELLFDQAFGKAARLAKTPLPPEVAVRAAATLRRFGYREIDLPDTDLGDDCLAVDLDLKPAEAWLHSRLAGRPSVRSREPVDRASLVRAIVEWLETLEARVAVAFDCPTGQLPARIDPSDGRLQAVRAWLARLPATACIADAGCGSGRYLRTLLSEFPGVRWIGIDPAAALLEQLPPEVERRQGSLLRLPANEAEFDGLMAIESLEHALLPKTAVGEMCRAVKRGGELLIIDKRREARALSEHAPWEQWFLPEEVAAWLEPACEAVDCQPIGHGPQGRYAGLFLRWRAVRGAGSAG